MYIKRKKMFDTHMHTEFSTDSDMKIQQAIETANEKRYRNNIN